jgi:hypothetical protein
MKKKRGPWYWYVDGYDPEMGHVSIYGSSGCSDRMCGAEDCSNCHPGMNWADRDEEEEEDDDDSCAE